MVAIGLGDVNRLGAAKSVGKWKQQSILGWSLVTTWPVRHTAAPGLRFLARDTVVIAVIAVNCSLKKKKNPSP